MMLRFTILLILTVFTSCDCYQAVTGTVVDKISDKPINGATVENLAKNSDKVMTDNLGFFEISSISGGFRCPPMRISVRKVGYKTAEVMINAGGNEKIEMELSDSISKNDTVFVSSTKELHSDSIPDYIFAMTDLRELSIMGMDCDVRPRTNCWMITAIPPQIAKLENLEKLYLNVNAISSLPIEITSLKKLKSLELSDNAGLTDIEYVTQLDNLENLSLFGCHLSKLPLEIGLLKKLKYLGLTGNNIGDEELMRIKKELPHCKIIFSK